MKNGNLKTKLKSVNKNKRQERTFPARYYGTIAGCIDVFFFCEGIPAVVALRELTIGLGLAAATLTVAVFLLASFFPFAALFWEAW